MDPDEKAISTCNYEIYGFDKIVMMDAPLHSVDMHLLRRSFGTE